MRIFIAIDIPEALKKEIGKVQLELRNTGADVRWVRPECLHLTLKFLGEIKPEELASISQRLRDSIRDINPFRFSINSLGAFPRPNTPRVVWVGVTPEQESLNELNKRIEDTLVPLGFSKEDRPFTPHLTIGRLRSGSYREKLSKKIDELKDISIGKVEVKKILIMESHLSPHGARYECKEEIELQG